MVIKRDGWEYDAESRIILAPRKAVLSPAQGAVFESLLLASGGPVALVVLADAIMKQTLSNSPKDYVAAVVCALNKAFRSFGIDGAGIMCVRGIGYRLRLRSSADLADGRRRAVEAILSEQLEATGPHARAISREIEKIYARDETRGQDMGETS